MNIRTVLLHGVLPLSILTGAGLGARHMVATTQGTEREPQARAAPLVRVHEVVAYRGGARVVGTGVVEPAMALSLSAEISGRVTFLADGLVEGGRVSQGQELIRIDRRRYQVAVKQSQAAVQQARATLELEENASEAARREWAAVGQEPTDLARRVVLRKPQIDSAAATIEAARGSLELAKLDLDKTSIRAPFNATVTAETVEVGDIVAPGGTLATLVGTDRGWARISVPVEALALIEFPQGDVAGSPVTVTQALATGRDVVRHGRVLRLVGALEASSRTAQVLVEIEHPFDPEPGSLPLLNGAFVSAEIEGRTLQGARVVPRAAVFEGDRLWVVDADDTLRRRTIVVALGDDDDVVATEGVEVGDRVVTTVVRTPTEGMRVRVEPAEQAGG